MCIRDRAPLAQLVELHLVAGRLDDLVAPDVDGGVVDAGPVGLAGAPEDQVARLQAVQGYRHPGRVVLVIGHPGELDAGPLAPRRQGEARAVVADRAVPAPDVGLPELLEGEEA